MQMGKDFVILHEEKFQTNVLDAIVLRNMDMDISN